MRPLELTIEGFKSYRDKCSFNFEGRGLFGIVGPTGAGKSSILDALIYALYGKTPRLERETKKLINSQGAEAKLQLSFEMDGIAWEVTRVLRRKGQSQVLLRRLDDGIEPVSGDRNVNDRIPQVLGLDFGAFCASVCLSQGEFDRFLSATASERVQILKGVFALDKVDALREVAKYHSRSFHDEIRRLQGVLETLPEDPEAEMEEIETGLIEARALVDEIRKEMPAVTAAEVELERSRPEERRIRAERERTQKLLSSLPAERGIQDLVDREEGSSTALEERERSLLSAEKAVEEAETALATIEAEGRGWEWCSRVESAVQARAELARDERVQAQTAAEREVLVERAREKLKGAEAAFMEADAAFTRSRAELSEIEQRHAAHVLRSGLVEGEACPVCEQTVHEIPATPGLPAVDAARDVCRKAEDELERVRRELESTRRELDLTEERLRTTREAALSLAGRIRQNAELLSSLVGENKDPQAEFEGAKRTLEELGARVRLAASARQKARDEHKRASAAHKAIHAEMLSTVTVLGGVCGQLGLDPGIIRRDGLLGALKAVQEQASLQLERLDRQAEMLMAAVEAARLTVAAFCSRFGAEPSEAPVEALGRAISRVRFSENRMEELKAARARKAEAEHESSLLTERKALFDRLATDLTDSKFTAYLLSEQTRLLCELASQKFHELTGYYTFDFDAEGSITVVDERTGAVRSPQDTLSGGETFLASLSLALALAETVASRGGRLECFFLDEGFGSLDAEALDRALDGIQTLAEPGRMIGLISHVGGIQSQLEDLIVLERMGDGSTSVVRDGGPISYLPAAI